MTGNMTAQKSGKQQNDSPPKRRLFGIVFVLSLLAAAVFFSLSGDDDLPVALTAEEIAALPEAPLIGARAPDFNFTDLRGDKASLSDFQGKPVVMMFFHSW